MDSADNFDLPSPHEPLDASCEQPLWCYDQALKSGDRRYSAYIATISGNQGDRLRRRLNAAISELLQWAAYQSGPASLEDEPPT
ncbi:hypothetical protein [Amycolatopsis thailandensis]|uniref:hypothetical protein n=1 Tax=Amycolatopsis thailandensis TaxID=589330 RepID=UPI0036354BD8